MNYRILTAGDQAIVLEFGKKIDPVVSRTVREAKNLLEAAVIPGVKEYIQTYCSLMVQYDLMATDYEEICKRVNDVLAKSTGKALAEKKRVIEIPVCYGGNFGPDFSHVCEHTGFSPEEVISRHTKTDYQIYMLGFLPGFAYLGGMDPALATPRLSSPREKLDCGAVGIAGGQTGIYPMESPGGWQIIGRTPVKPYDPDRQVPILYQAGDYIRFFPISEQEFEEISQAVAQGTYQCTWREEV